MMLILPCLCFLQTGYLGLIGGINVKTTTTAIMKTVMSTELARGFNFCGHRGKHGFASLHSAKRCGQIYTHFVWTGIYPHNCVVILCWLLSTDVRNICLLPFRGIFWYFVVCVQCFNIVIFTIFLRFSRYLVICY